MERDEKGRCSNRQQTKGQARETLVLYNGGVHFLELGAKVLEVNLSATYAREQETPRSTPTKKTGRNALNSITLLNIIHTYYNVKSFQRRNVNGAKFLWLVAFLNLRDRAHASSVPLD